MLETASILKVTIRILKLCQGHLSRILHYHWYVDFDLWIVLIISLYPVGFYKA